MRAFALDTVGVVFCSLALLAIGWVVFDPIRVLRLLSYNRRSSFPPLAIQTVRLSGAVVLIGICFLLVTTLLVGIR